MKMLIIRNAFERDFGGAETYALNLSIALKGLGHSSMVVTRVSELISRLQNNDIKTIRGPWNSSQNWGLFGHYAFGIRYFPIFAVVTMWYIYIILRYKVDVVCPQSRDDFIFATAAAKLLNKRVIWTDHGDLKYALNQKVHPNKRMRSWLIFYAKYAKRIICVSNSEASEISAVAPELKNLTVVHNGVFILEHLQHIKHPVGVKYIIGTTSRLVKAKGVGELLEAFALIKHSRKSELWLLGEGDDRKFFEELSVKLGIMDRVKFFGYQSSPLNYVAAMDIYIHSSYHEAFSLAIIEAAMLNRPIIATNVGGTPEIIDDHCGKLVRPGSVQDLVTAIDYYMDNPDIMAKNGRAAGKKARENFDFHQIVRTRILPIYLGANE